MVCYFCGSDQSKVIDKRTVKTLGGIRRRRECLKCKGRFTTYETVSVVELYVIKRDGRRELFNKDKIKAGLTRALEKRSDIDKVSMIADKIEARLKSQRKTEIQTKIIGKMVLGELKKLDKIAYLRFASVYRRFDDPKDFAKELQVLN